MNVPLVKVTWDAGADTVLPLPSYQTVGAAGADLRANLQFMDREEGLLLEPMGRRLVPTGLRIEIPAGFEAQIRPRSGLAFEHGVTLVNTPGTIDSDYRGPVGVLMVNLGHESYIVSHGERIAQIVVAPVVQAHFGLTDALSDTPRGTGGFGSTGRG